VELTLSNSLVEGAIEGPAVTDGGGNILGESAELLPLADNGGLTETHALAATSPALDGGDPGFTPPPATDQRGLARVQGEAIDIGAYETQPTEEPVDPTDPVDPTTPPPGALPVVANPTFTG
ncbi:MAG: choice-of-anchor Q domain-containing protein, partial [Acidimicrobiales bacterium]